MAPRWRDRLPEPAQRPNLGFASLFSFCKDVVGSDVSLQKDLSLPVSFCEPLADLQRRGEFMSYSELLDQARCCSFCMPVFTYHSGLYGTPVLVTRQYRYRQAAAEELGSVQRLLLMTCYAISSYSCVDRTWAPFRSPTGETYEMVDEEKGIRLVAEKVHAAACLRTLNGTFVRQIIT